jgi:coenzyme PQQ synthesis protein D (PqqD)
MIRLSTICRRHPGVRFRVLDGQAVVLNQTSAEVLVLDEVATRILSLADGEVPIARWVEILGREYDVTQDVLERDLLDFATELVHEGLLEAVPPAAPPGIAAPEAP